MTLGGACQGNGDCAAGLICIRPNDNVSTISPAGVGNGVCTAECLANPALCDPLGGSCLAVDANQQGTVTRAICFENCTLGPHAKCHNREDIVCEPVDQAETQFQCVPLCVTNADCAGRKCDPASGLCVDALPPAGKSVGSGCTVVSGQRNTECDDGVCLPLATVPDGGSGPGVCSGFCRLGTSAACGFRAGPLVPGSPTAACVLPWGATGYDVGDLGLCLQLCDSVGDCSYQANDWTCRTEISVAGHSVCLVPAGG